ncbi:cell division protein FtsQ [Enterococcus ureilyticus]|uniref:Cell division protein DivIB n=1 Tax=Enterococcus ureilyticus TaxID=1131292 RepID=A0A1E5HE73_9ENTE|nr:cell division protein FtsQ/DivIB [Enterococcus ureilyticus]MBO0446287.1 FtsQ-type POTRA domain-containing protein [Enterococcus ureilyticus]OEG23257.1 cell division protein FtsQ [Enterococcus ureilyticus]
MTPWQKENLEYLKKHGNQPVWNPSVVSEEAEQEEVTEENATETEDSTEEPETEEKQKKTYESFADRLPKIKEVRNKRLYRRLTLIVSVFLIAILIVLYFVSPLSKLGSISVTGSVSVDNQQVIAQSKLEKGKSLWEQFGDRTIYEEKIKRQLPRVKKATISLSGINSFNIKIDEYEVVALESVNNVYHPILENGKILPEEMSAPISGMPVFQNFQDQSIIKNLMDSYKKLPEDIKQNISEIRYTPSNANKELITLHMKDANEVIVNISQLVEKMAYYGKVASQMEKPGIIDMEVGIFSYPFNNESTEESVDESSQALE